MTTPIENRPTLYAMLKAEGCELSNHETDLYVVDTPAAREIIALFESYGGKSNKERFSSNIDGRPHFDLPFHYAPKWVRDSRPTTYQDGKDAQISDIEQDGDDRWIGTAKDGREIAVRINGTRIEVSVAAEGAGRAVAVAGFSEQLPGCERYWVEAGDLLDRAEGRTTSRILTLAGLTMAAHEPVASPAP